MNIQTIDSKTIEFTGEEKVTFTELIGFVEKKTSAGESIFPKMTVPTVTTPQIGSPSSSSSSRGYPPSSLLGSRQAEAPSGPPSRHSPGGNGAKEHVSGHSGSSSSSSSSPISEETDIANILEALRKCHKEYKVFDINPDKYFTDDFLNQIHRLGMWMDSAITQPGSSSGHGKVHPNANVYQLKEAFEWLRTFMKGMPLEESEKNQLQDVIKREHLIDVMIQKFKNQETW